jgi:Zn finger protein HypA/HybF involved in hydrogenase expression
MKPRPLWVHVWGLGRLWRARVAARLGKTDRWRKVRAEYGREVEATSAALAARKAIVAYGRESARCRLCGGAWERRRGTKRTVCPRCHNRRRSDHDGSGVPRRDPGA